MTKVEVCMRLSKIGWMSQMVTDHRRTLRTSGEGYCSSLLYGAYEGTRLSSLIMDKIHWSATMQGRTWSERYGIACDAETTIGDITL